MDLWLTKHCTRSERLLTLTHTPSVSISRSNPASKMTCACLELIRPCFEKMLRKRRSLKLRVAGIVAGRIQFRAQLRRLVVKYIVKLSTAAAVSWVYHGLTTAPGAATKENRGGLAVCTYRRPCLDPALPAAKLSTTKCRKDRAALRG